MKQKLLAVSRVLLSMQRMSWEQGVAAQAFFECGDKDMGLLLVREALHRSNSEGLIGITDKIWDSVDCGANGLPAFYAYQATNEGRYLKAVNDLADWFEFSAPRSLTGQIYHNPDTCRFMIDGIYHMVPVLMVAGRTEFAMKQLNLFHERHFEPKTGLYRQLWDEKINSYSRRALWGGGQGWMAGALAIACRFLEDDPMNHRETLEKWLSGLVDSIMRYVREDGLFHDVLDDPTTFAEITATLMLCYAIYTAVNAGALPAKYKEAADRLLNLAESHVDEDGFVNTACSSPTFDRLGNSAEAQAFYMLCHAAKGDCE